MPRYLIGPPLSRQTCPRIANRAYPWAAIAVSAHKRSAPAARLLRSSIMAAQNKPAKALTAQIFETLHPIVNR
jgi:hypothetical protein